VAEKEIQPTTSSRIGTVYSVGVVKPVATVPIYSKVVPAASVVLEVAPSVVAPSVVATSFVAGMQKEQLIQEILFDKDFYIDDCPPSRNSNKVSKLTRKVLKSIYGESFWAGFAIELATIPPSYSCFFKIMREIKDALLHAGSTYSEARALNELIDMNDLCTMITEEGLNYKRFENMCSTAVELIKVIHGKMGMIGRLTVLYPMYPIYKRSIDGTLPYVSHI
jgi:hypothetical protein